MKYCQNCGNQSEDSATFCSFCGCQFQQQMNTNTNVNNQVANYNSDLPVVALILAFIFPLIGLILGIYSNNQCKIATGQSNSMSKAAIIVSLAFIIMGILFVLFYFLIIVAALSH